MTIWNQLYVWSGHTSLKTFTVNLILNSDLTFSSHVENLFACVKLFTSICDMYNGRSVLKRGFCALKEENKYNSLQAASKFWNSWLLFCSGIILFIKP